MEAHWVWLMVVWLGGSLASAGAASVEVRVGTYNVENYVLESTPTRAAKSEAGKAKVAESVRRLGVDVLALQEVGGAEALEDLRRRVARLGWEYRHGMRVAGPDTNIQVALLSRYRPTAWRAHTNDAYLLAGRRFRVSRGFLEAELDLGSGRRLTVFVAHLKSRRTSVKADEAEMRREEARLLRRRVEGYVEEHPGVPVVILGDMNDTRDSESVRGLVGRGRGRWVDTRPAEANGDSGWAGEGKGAPRTVAWTHHYGAEDTYSRVDYIFLETRAAAAWVAGESEVLGMADWGVASDHRPLRVTLRWGRKAD